MKRALLRVHDLDAERGAYPVELYVDGPELLLEQRIAEAEIPGALSPPALPKLDGAAAGREEIRRFLLRPDPGSSPGYHAIGTYLYELLAQGDVGRKWRALADAHQLERPPHSEGLSLLLDIRPSELSSLPWELMARGPYRIATEEGRPLSRAHPQFSPASDDTVTSWPVRVMVIVGSKPTDLTVKAAAERAELIEAFRRHCGLVDLELLEQRSPEEVEAAYRELQPHILHFVGHGRRDPEDGSAHLELFDAAANKRYRWGVQDIRRAFGTWRPRLAILNACRTAGVDGQEDAWAASDALFELGVPAVIAMQGDIMGEAAVRFSGEFYRGLAAGQEVDVAVARGRGAVGMQMGWNRRDFALPALVTKIPPEHVITIRFGVDDDARMRIEADEAFGNVKAFVDRTRERRRMWSRLRLEPLGPGIEDEAAGLAVIGDSQVGKSELVRWCIGASLLRGRNVAYVNLKRKETIPFLPALGLIAQALSEAPIAQHRARNQAAFTHWLELVDELLGPPDPPPVGDGHNPFHRDFRPGREDAINDIFECFREALTEAAGDQPLILALDHVDRVVEASWSSYIGELLIRPIAMNDLRPVRVIVVLRRERVSERLTPGLQAALRQIEVGEIPRDAFMPLARQYLRHRGYDPGDFDKVISALSETLPAMWKPEVLSQVEGIATSAQWKRSD